MSGLIPISTSQVGGEAVPNNVVIFRPKGKVPSRPLALSFEAFSLLARIAKQDEDRGVAYEF